MRCAALVVVFLWVPAVSSLIILCVTERREGWFPLKPLQVLDIFKLKSETAENIHQRMCIYLYLSPSLCLCLSQLSEGR